MVKEHQQRHHAECPKCLNGMTSGMSTDNRAVSPWQQRPLRTQTILTVLKTAGNGVPLTGK